MTRQDYQQFIQEFFEKCIEISQKKGADYAFYDDILSNFKGTEAYRIPPTIGFITRMHDKMSRLASFAKKGFLEVEDESITDTLQDLANYCCLFAAYIKETKPNYPDEWISDVA